jgi:hypothetical protein
MRRHDVRGSCAAPSCFASSIEREVAEVNNRGSGDSAGHRRSAGLHRFSVLMAIIVVVIVVLALWLGPDPIPFRDFAYDDIVRLLAAAFLVALLIERANEVIINVWRGKGKADLNRQYLAARVAATASAGGTTGAGRAGGAGGTTGAGGTVGSTGSGDPTRAPDAALATAPAVLEKEAQLDARRAENQRYTLVIGFVLGIVAAALGVRLLMPLLDGRVVDELSRTHHNLLIAFDVLITGTLLGGGASGLHSILDLVQKALDSRRDSFRKAQQDRDASAAGGR